MSTELPDCSYCFRRPAEFVDFDGDPICEHCSIAPTEPGAERTFNNGYGLEEGAPVLAWSETRVYFPVCYDGSEWIASAPRNPQAEGQGHVGG